MNSKYCILPCNGLDKCAGDVSRRVALELSKDESVDLICPVLLNKNKTPYMKKLQEKPLCVIDGCNTRCASKLAAEMGIAIKEKYNVSEFAKENEIKLGIAIRNDEETKKLVSDLAKKIITSDDLQGKSEYVLSEVNEFGSYSRGKFIFKVPKTNYYFNENDCWVSISENVARVGVSDYIQQNLSDILYVDSPEVGMHVEQFDDLGSIESSKTVFEIISPISGTIIAVNEELEDAPELVNESPYEKGWLVEVKIDNFEEDQELLLKYEEYFEVLKRKVEEIEL